MKYISSIYKSGICRGIMFLVVFWVGLLVVQAQDAVFKNGIQQGVVKVKFEPSMTATLSQMQVKTKGKTLSTGITNLDKAVNSINGIKMERLIPECPNVALEAKHRKAGLHLWYIVEFDQSVDVNTAIKSLKSVPGVSKVEAEHFKAIAPTKVTPYIPGPTAFSTQPFNDPYLKDQWHYINTGQLGLNEKADANMGPAWNVTAGRSDIIVSVHDEGIDVSHEDLRANMWVNPNEIAGDGIDNDGNGYIDDIHGFNFVDLTGSITPQSHGTHVAGTVAAVNNNGIGVSGVAGGTGNGDGVKIMSLQIIGGATAGYIMRSFVYAADMGAVISQNSWGYNSPGVYEQDVLDGIDYFISNAGDYPGSPMKGGIVIFASGNDNYDALWYPGAYEKCLSVSSIGPEWKKASYSNFADWVTLSAPGGDQDTYGMAKAGVLSTLPGNQYGYMHGTSMACPHVSGIAALALASSDKQMTNTELWQRLVTSVKDIDVYNPSYIGKMGVGTIDAELAVKTDKGLAPDKITTLTLKGIAQEFATLEWTIPADEDDGIPTAFYIYYHTDELTNSNLGQAQFMEVRNVSEVGETITIDVTGLHGNTLYYFGVVSSDRWGNRSELSNTVSASTNEGPSIDINTGSQDKTLSLSANAAVSAIGMKSFELLNNAEGLLRWEYSVGNTWHEHSLAAYSLTDNKAKYSAPKGIGMINAREAVPVIRNTDAIAPAAFTTVEKIYSSYPSVYIGDTDPTLPTSGAVRFVVNEEDGFNLTQIRTNLKYTEGTGPIIVEIYKGNALTKDKLCGREEYTPDVYYGTAHYIPLKEHIYFEKGTEFYVVVHIPENNGYSLGLGIASSTEYTNYCLYSADKGATWSALTSVGISQGYAWCIGAVSQVPFVEQFIMLDPASGTLEGDSKTDIELTANGTTLINGTYKANVIFKSNDSENQEFRMPVVFDISGHKPEMVYPKIVNFGSVFKGDVATLDILLENIGYGLIKDLNVSLDNSQFEIQSYPSTVEARSEGMIRVKFTPESIGNINGKLNISNGQYTYSISLFGVGAETSEIEITPASQTIPNITIGDEVESTVTIKNKGAYPLQYFIPGFDTQGISSDWPASYHSYGYVIRSNDTNIDENASLTYNFVDITSTGVDITNHFVDSHYKEVPFGFDFPYYGEIQEKVFITKNGFTVFDNNANPFNSPKLKGDLKGYVSITGFSDYTSILNSKIYYKAESDRFILQYDKIGIGDTIFTAQIQYYANGNIQFHYKDIPQESSMAREITILIEDVAQTDGILVRDYNSDFFIKNETVIGFDYPGPDIITSVENGSGILAPNETSTVKVKMSTESLSEGDITRNISVISNDPTHPSASFSTLLNITSGGTEEYTVSDEEVDFGIVYQGFSYTNEFSIRNKGTKAIKINSLSFDNAKYDVTGSLTIAPGINEIYEISPVTTNIAELEDVLQIEFENGSTENITLKASVRTAPVIVSDLTELSASMDLNEQKSFPYEIENTGGSDLEVSVINGQWFRFEETTDTDVNKYDYHVKMEYEGQPSFNWIDILATGNKVDYNFDQSSNKDVFWTEVELPFTFIYYGKEYDKIKLGYNGIIALGGDPDAYPSRSQVLPIEDTETAFIFPFWAAGEFNTYSYPEDAGLYYQTYDDKIVISWMYFFNPFGWGESFQAILQNDGLIKFQYRQIDGINNGTNTGIVGIQNIGMEEYTTISNGTSLPIDQGLAYLVVPDNKHIVSPNSKMEGNIIFDTRNIYGGIFDDELLIKSNAPTTPESSKPLKIDVAGTAKVEVPAEIDLGDVEVVFDESTWSYKSIIKPLEIKNTGTAPFRITGAAMETGGQYLTQLVLVSTMWGISWTPIENLWGAYPEKLLLPGESFNSYVSFAPEIAGTYEDVLVLSSTIGDIRVKLKGFGYDSPVINIDDTPINVSFNTFEETKEETIAFNNEGGGYKLDYNISVSYRRGITEATSLAKTITPKLGLENTLLSKINANTKSVAAIIPFADSFNREIQYVDENKFNNAMGQNGNTATIAATRFTADKEGFTLSDVGSYVQLQKGVTGTIKVEVKVGGTNISNALPMASKDVEFTYPEGTEFNEVVAKLNVTLDEPVQVLPNEEFYVIFTYPMDLNYPQTLQIGGVDLASGRYLWFQDGEWFDLQDYLGGYDPESGYVMYAAEREFKESGWVKILTTETGTLQIDENTETKIQIRGSFAERGDQSANLVVRTNDVNASVVQVPISLHMNEAPLITVPTTLITAEKEVSEVEASISDKEGQEFEVEVTDVPTFVEYNQENGDIKFTVSPDYGDAGTYTISIKATDEYEAVSVGTIEINVAKTNRAPEYIGEETTFRYNVGASAERMDINDLFLDPDGDKFTFVVTCLDKNIVEVYQSGSDYFIVEPKAVGTTALEFVVTDVHNGTTVKQIEVVVDECSDPEGLIVQKWNYALLVNNANGTYIGYQWYKNGSPVAGATRQYFAEENAELDFNADYFVELTYANGTKRFTCPVTPEKKDISLKAYPNPVKQGESVKVEAQLPDLGNNPLTIQIINMSGQIVRTISTSDSETSIPMNFKSGTYLLKVTNNNVEESFNIIVQ